MVTQTDRLKTYFQNYLGGAFSAPLKFWKSGAWLLHEKYMTQFIRDIEPAQPYTCHTY